MKNFAGKVTALTMTATMVLTMAGCKESSSNTTEKSQGVETTAAEESPEDPAESQAQPSEKLAKIYENIVYATIATGKWEEDDDYCYSRDDLKAYFSDVSEENNLYQLLLTKGLFDRSNTQVYSGENGAAYHYLADSETFSSFVSTMYGADADFYKKLTTEDLGISSLIYDAETDAIYFFEGMVTCYNCSFVSSEVTKNGTIDIVYHVTNECDDATPIKGNITINVSDYDCDGWYEEVNQVSFDKD